MIAVGAGAKRRVSAVDLVGLLALLAYALRPVLPAAVLAGVGAIALLAAMRPFAPDRGFSRAACATMGSLCLYLCLPMEWKIWPAYKVVPFAAALAISVTFGFGGDFRRAAAVGRLGRQEWVIIALIAAVAAAALIGWVMLLQPDLQRQRAMLPEWPIFGLIAAGLTFSVVNALMEEFLWRGLLLRWLAAFMSPAAAVVVQAASFGAAHYSGFPSGFTGVTLAFLYGAMIGALALRSGGLLAPVVAHIAADAVIFALLAASLES